MANQERHPAHPVEENPLDHIGDPVVVDYDGEVSHDGGTDSKSGTPSE